MPARAADGSVTSPPDFGVVAVLPALELTVFVLLLAAAGDVIPADIVGVVVASLEAGAFDPFSLSPPPHAPSNTTQATNRKSR